jgi:hypothetical protein
VSAIERIPIQDTPPVLTFQLEGRLSGPWVREVEACWQVTLACQHEPRHPRGLSRSRCIRTNPEKVASTTARAVDLCSASVKKEWSPAW